MGIRLKTIIMFSIVVLSISVVTILAVRKFLFYVVEKDYGISSWEIASAVGATVDTEALSRVREQAEEIFFSIPPEKRLDSSYWGEDEWYEYLSYFEPVTETEDFQNLMDYMKFSLDALNVEDVYLDNYLYDPVDDRWWAMYLVDPAEGEDNCPVGTVEMYIELTDEFKADPGIGLEAYITRTEEYGWLMTATPAIVNENGDICGYISVDMSMNEIIGSINSFVHTIVIVIVLIAAVFGIIYIILINRAIIRPINTLSEAAAKYSSVSKDEGENVFSEIEIKSRDEIGRLCDSMKQMEKDINEYVGNITELNSEKEKINAEMKIAWDIQSSILPSNFEEFSENNHLETYAMMTPAKQVGGDFYDFFNIDDDHVGLVIADVSGKGIPASLFMAVAKTAMQSRALSGGDAKTIMTEVNTWLCENNESEQFVTALLGILDLRTGVMQYANAGHEYPVIISGDYVSVLHGDNDPPLAAIAFCPYGNKELTLSDGDILVLYTDGIPEAKNADGERYGMDRIAIVLKDYGNVETRVKRLHDDVIKFTGEADIFDDITLLGVKFKKRA